MKQIKHSLLAAVLASAAFAVAPTLAANEHAGHAQHDHSQHAGHGDQVDHSKHMMQPAEKPSSVKVKLLDSRMVDQDGVLRKLKSDVIGDKLAVISFAYTSCTTVCPALTALMAKLQAELLESGPSGVQLVTITLDPARDTPARMRAFGKQYDVKPGWVWLTGQTGHVHEVLKGLGAYTPRFEDHPPLVLVGDPVSGNWTRFVGFTDPKELLEKVRQLKAARSTGK